MNHPLQNYDLSNAVNYHYGGFPPEKLDFGTLIGPMAQATEALARYDQMLQSLHNSEILLATLRGQEAVVSSRIENTISTMDEIFRIEAELEDDEAHSGAGRQEAIEVFLYSRSLKKAQLQIQDGYPLSENLILQIHRQLMGFGRGANKRPGQYKETQNYVGSSHEKNISFIPISPDQLSSGIQTLMEFIETPIPNDLPLLAIALAHVEFEALHPFDDGNGRIGRMLITLLLWKMGVIKQPHFYISGYLEEAKDEYIERMRAVSAEGDWNGWVTFFLNALTFQAKKNLDIANRITNLYDEMKPVFREVLSSRWGVQAQDFMFTEPVFRNTRFIKRSGIPKPTAARFTRALYDRGLLVELEPAAGSRAALYAFEPLLVLVRV